MQPLNCLFIAQGEGRGHLTQALAVRAILRRAGHQVCNVLVGNGSSAGVPDYFREKIDAPLTFFDSAHFVTDAQTRSIRWPATVHFNGRQWPRFRESLDLIDTQIRRHQPDVVINFYDPGFAKDVIRWHTQHPEVTLHCFWNQPDADEVEAYDDTLTFHRLHDERFLSMMARARGVITSSGFECMTEAMYLGKPLLMVPIRGHFEQHCNAVDGGHLGVGIEASNYAIDRLIAFIPHYRQHAAHFRAWVDQAEERFIEEIEGTIRQRMHIAPQRQGRPGGLMVSRSCV